MILDHIGQKVKRYYIGWKLSFLLKNCMFCSSNYYGKQWKAKRFSNNAVLRHEYIVFKNLLAK